MWRHAGNSESMSAEDIRAQLAGVRARRAGLVVGAWDGAEAFTWHTGRLPDGAGSIFEIGSITKVFTATLLADMARHGLVGLDDPVWRHLPEGVRPPVRGREITLEDLASHRSGLPRLPKGMSWPAYSRNRRDPYAPLDAAWLEAAVARTRPRREPGRRAVYSNYGAGLLGHVLARRAGCSYDELVRRRIGEPLGLSDTGVAVDGGRLATGHSRLGRPVPHWHFDALAGAGALRSTAGDLLTFLRLHAGEPSEPLADAASETQAPRMRRGRVRFGLGWVMLPPARRVPFELLVHDGGTGGFRSFAALSPERRLAVVVLANRVRGVATIGLRALAALG
jgi:serine-type D-Ala-D-Ala carboxypeptidase/endopeptidase